jgi:hypothetical protein
MMAIGLDHEPSDKRSDPVAAPPTATFAEQVRQLLRGL